MKSLKDLEEKLTVTRDWSDHDARSYERRNTLCWWIAVCLAAIASVVGFLMQVEPIRKLALVTDSGWIVSLITASGAGVETLRRTSRWRQLSKVTWKLNKEVIDILALISFEIADQDDSTKAKTGSVLFRKAQERFGTSRDTILDQREVSPKLNQVPDDGHTSDATI